MDKRYLGLRRVFPGTVAVVVLIVIAAGCSPSDGGRNSSRPRVDKGNVDESLGNEVKSFMAQYPSVVRGRLGTSDTSAFLDIATPHLTDRPYGREDGVLLTAGSLFAAAPQPAEMPALSRVVARGRVLAIGLPHFNSTDGSFWAPELHDQPGVTDVARMIIRDVLFQVDEVWGSLLPEIAPGSLVRFAVRGGQIAVNLPAAVADQLELGGAGVYIFSEESPVNISVGENAVTFLDVTPILGLYDDQYAARFELFPAQESGFKYVYKEVPNTIGLPGESGFDISIPDIQSIIQQELGQDAWPEAELGSIVPQPPHAPGG